MKSNKNMGKKNINIYIYIIKMYRYVAKKLITIAVYICVLKSLRLSQRDIKISLSS